MKETVRVKEVVVASKPVPFDFSNVIKQTRRMSGTEITLDWNSYRPDTKVLAAQLISELSQEAGAGPHPGHLSLLDLGPGTPDVAGVPATEKSASTVELRWSKDGSRAVLDFSKLLMLRPLGIPRGARAHIPISQTELPGHGPVVMFHFGDLRFEPIEAGSKKRKDSVE